MAVGTRCADHVTPLYPQKLALTSPTGGSRTVSIVRVWTKAMEFVCFCLICQDTDDGKGFFLQVNLQCEQDEKTPFVFIRNIL